MVPDGGCLYVEGGVHFCMGVYFQLHNTGLGFCADCPAEGDIVGCAMMLAPCNDSRQQQVGGQSSQGTGQGKPGSGLSWDAPHFPLGHLLLVGPHPLMDHSPIVMTHHTPAHPDPTASTDMDHCQTISASELEGTGEAV